MKHTTFRKTDIFLFVCYFLISLSLALYINREVIFNAYSYGRHWDWTFYPLSDFYKNYLQSFASSMKENALGYFDVISVSVSEFLLKGLIYYIYRIFSLLGLWIVTIPIIYKLVLFVGFPIVSSLGMWKLSSRVLNDIKDADCSAFFLITLLVNLLYTFSSVLIFDAHGGALNRQITAICIPWFLLFIFNYFQTTDRIEERNLLLQVSLFFILYDLANLFFFGLVVLAAILFKKMPLLQKLRHTILFGIIIVLLNVYWLHTFIIGNVVGLQTILSERHVDLAPLLQYSSNYLDTFFQFNVPHNLIRRTYTGNRLIYVPFFFLFFFLIWNLVRIKFTQKNIRLLLFIAASFIIITVLTSGVYGIGKIYVVLYSIPVLGFIRAALRYVPVLLGMSVFFLIISFRERFSANRHIKKLEKLIIALPIVLWLFFLCTHTDLFDRIMFNVVPLNSVNQDIGALYKYNSKSYEAIRNDRLIYNVLPVPSWFSPVFIDNERPKTSQGSNTDDLFFGKGMLYTSNVTLFSSVFFDQFIKQPSSAFFSLANVKKVTFNQALVSSDVTEHNFSYRSIINSFPEDREKISSAIKNQQPYSIASNVFYPVVYTPKQTIIEDVPPRYLPQIIKEKNPFNPFAVILESQNEGMLFSNTNVSTITEKQPIIEFKKISPSKYRILVHQASTAFPLILSRAYYKDWHLYLIDNSPYNKKDRAHLETSTLQNYKILDDNSDTQATTDELIKYIQNGWISTVGNLREKKYQHKTFVNSYEIPTYTEKYKIDFISKIFQNTIQNDTITNTNSTMLYREISQKQHFIANGYANAWIVDPKNICVPNTRCHVNSDGSYDFDIVAEFIPQRLFQKMLSLSLIVFILLSAYITYFFKIKKKIN